MAKDLHIQLIDPTEQRYGANFTFGFKSPILVDGIQKLANQWLKIFLTPKGSHPWRRLEGTNFAYLIGGNVDDVDTIQTAILEYIEDATTQLKAIQSRQLSLPDTERLFTVNLLQFTQVDTLSFDIWVRIVNVARSTLSVLIPYAKVKS
jgi:hypothetical protein